jgi:hypothetical protein
MMARRKRAKKRSLQRVNAHFELGCNAASGAFSEFLAVPFSAEHVTGAPT